MTAGSNPLPPHERPKAKIIRFFFKPPALLVGFLFYTAIRILEPWRRVKVGILYYERIGHLAQYSELFFRQLLSRRNRNREWFLLISGPPSNQQLVTMIGRRHATLVSQWAVRFYTHGLLPFIEGTRFHEVLPFNSYDYHPFRSLPPQMSFTREEESQGIELLARLGVKGQFICFHSRDSAYLDREHTYASNEQWKLINSHRDSHVENYLPATRSLADSGLAAIRMGSVVERPIQPPHPSVIDYATRQRSDFADIYLLSRCKFFLGNTAGLACVPMIFNRPIAVANLVPLIDMFWRDARLAIPKKYRRRGAKEFLPFAEMLKLGAGLHQRTEQFTALGIEIVENTAQEILDLALEMNARLDGTWKEEPGDYELQKRYWRMFDGKFPNTDTPALVGAKFLRENQNLL